jgi:hypothetical protein
LPRIRRAFPALLPILIALALGACGSDDNEDSGKSADPGKTKTETRGAASGGGAQDNPPDQEITSCLGKAGLNVIVSSGSVVDADYREYEGSSGRTVEVVGDTLFAYFPARPDARRVREVRPGPQLRPLGIIPTRRREEAYAARTG